MLKRTRIIVIVIVVIASIAAALGLTALVISQASPSSWSKIRGAMAAAPGGSSGGYKWGPNNTLCPTACQQDKCNECADKAQQPLAYQKCWNERCVQCLTDGKPCSSLIPPNPIPPGWRA